MEFCSEYGYDYGFDGSDNDSFEEIDELTQKKVTKKIRQVDSNLIAVKFDELVNSNETFAGEPKHCTRCQAIVSPLSIPNIKQENNIFIWTCEFCETINDLSKQMLQSQDEIPKKDDVTFLIEPASQRRVLEKIKSSDNNYLIYCMDISGSMDNVTKFRLDNNNNVLLRDRYLQLIEGVKIACLENLTYLKDSEPNKKISLVTFNNSVKFYGDGTKTTISNPLVNTSNVQSDYRNPQQQQQQQQRRPANSNLFGRMFCLNINCANDNNNTAASNSIPSNNQEIARDILQNREKMLSLGQSQSSDLKGIFDSFTSLKNIIENLKADGSTALGPALVFSLGYLTGKDGSQIILCTDGAANIGMGAIGHSVFSLNDSYEFYDKLGDYAKSKNITVNIITIEGTDCRLAILSKLADKTNGKMSVVNQSKLSNEFKSILDNKIVATSVKATLIVNHRYLYIRDTELEKEEARVAVNGKENLDRLKKSKLVKDIGNVNLGREITFEYGIRRQKVQPPIEKIDEMPFQLQIEYVHKGAKLTRVFTKKQKFTKEKSEAIKHIVDKNIICMNSVQRTSEHALNDNIEHSRLLNRAMNNFVSANRIVTPKRYDYHNEMLRNSPRSPLFFSDPQSAKFLEAKTLSRAEF